MTDNTVSGEMLEIEQRHREAAASVHAAKHGSATPGYSWFLEGEMDDDELVQAFARFERDHMPAHSTPSVDGEMLEALKPFAEKARIFSQQADGVVTIRMDFAHFRRALAAIKRAESA